jgi:hypothetical protein
MRAASPVCATLCVRMQATRDELTGFTAGALVLVFVAAVALGWLIGGPVGAVAGGAIGAFGGVVAGSWRGVQRARSMLDVPRVDVRPLPPQQALAVMSAIAGSQSVLGGATFRSALLARLEEIREMAPRDPREALLLASELSDDYPRSPAARGELARRLFAVGDCGAGIIAASEAIALALDGGMNPAAAALFDELGEHRETIVLRAAHLERLARVLENRDDRTGAAWCRARLEQSPPP